MRNIKKVQKSIINKIYKNPNSSGLSYDIYGKYNSIKEYSEDEINEMYLGIYRHKKHLLVDGDYFINIENVIKTECVLESVSYYKKPSIESTKDNSCNLISNIRTFYIRDYYLVTKDPVFGNTRHRITRFLYKIGFLNIGRGKYIGLYSIANDYKTILNGKYPKDLYHPIKKYINGLFFNDDYKIYDFDLITSIRFKTNS